MDSKHGRQNSMNCDLCESPDHRLHCETCQINLCKACVGNHLLDSSVRHQTILLENRDSALIYSICKEHSPKPCELHCEECDVFICVHCVTSSNHQNHKIVGTKRKFESKTDDLQKDLHELENLISKKYHEIKKDVKVQLSDIDKHFNKLGSALHQLKEKLYVKINEIISRLEKDLDEIRNKLWYPLFMQKLKIDENISEINQSISHIKYLLKSNEVCQVSAYKSKLVKFRKLPPKLTVYLPKLLPPVHLFNKFWERFDAFSSSHITSDARGYLTETTEATLLPFKRFLDEPRVVKIIKTDYKGFLKDLRNVSCNDESEFWTSGKDSMIKLYNIKAELLESIKTKSGNDPLDIATKMNGDLVYTDPNDGSLNIVKNQMIKNLCTVLSFWQPRNVSCTYNDGLLVIMDNSIRKETKVVLYTTDSKEEQSIQFNDKGQPLFSFGDIKYLSENRNLDICVADHGAHAIVVVNRAGKLRFTYSGPTSIGKGSFDPYGIATDSQGMIFTADSSKHRIHILDQDGQFFRYIDNCDIYYPWGICIDKEDNLFVAENRTGKVKIIKYY